MSDLKSDMERRLFLGVDGGQSHTEAITADHNGNIIGRGIGGPSNHADQPGGRERLRNAVVSSVTAALRTSGPLTLDEVLFSSAHFGMTGGADYKEEIITELVRSDRLTVGHDAPAALCGATAGQPGIVVIAGTGSVIYGENAEGKSVTIGGLGYLFSDEGSGFWLAAEVIRLAIKEQDGLRRNEGLERLVLDFFGHGSVRELTNDFYNQKISRDELASFGKRAQEAVQEGSLVIRQQMEIAIGVLVESVRVCSERLDFTVNFRVAAAGGMFRGKPMRDGFKRALRRGIPKADLRPAEFCPGIGALLLAYRGAGLNPSREMLGNLNRTAQR